MNHSAQPQNFFRPCLDLHEGKVKQIVGATLAGAQALRENFVSLKEAGYYAALYKKAGLTGGHLIMLGEGDREKNEAAARQALSCYPQGLSVGGGITLSSAARWLAAGARAIIFTSYLFPAGRFSPVNFERIKKELPREKVIFDLSAIEHEETYFVASQCWRNRTNFKLSRANLVHLSEAAHEFLIHAVAREGTQRGVDYRLVRHLQRISPINWVYAGGVGSLEEIKKLLAFNQVSDCAPRKNPLMFFTVGSALDLFGGPLSYEAVVALGRTRRKG